MEPEILSPNQEPLHARTHMGGGLFSNENLDLLAHVLDDCFRIPWTSIRFGIDGLIGLVPFAGDVLAGLASCIIVIAAWFRGVPYITLTRMVVNIGLDVLIGAIPIAGDAFDIAWKANRRNYKLLSRELQQPHRHTWRDYAFLGFLALVLFLIFAIPVAVLAWLLTWLLQHA
jgi:NAD/NADP transhydrogenase beta subunit